jgi:hypothetical protein
MNPGAISASTFVRRSEQVRGENAFLMHNVGDSTP